MQASSKSAIDTSAFRKAREELAGVKNALNEAEKATRGAKKEQDQHNDSIKKGAKKAQSKIKDIKITPNLQFEVDDIDFAKIKNKLQRTSCVSSVNIILIILFIYKLKKLI